MRLAVTGSRWVSLTRHVKDLPSTPSVTKVLRLPASTERRLELVRIEGHRSSRLSCTVDDSRQKALCPNLTGGALAGFSTRCCVEAHVCHDGSNLKYVDSPKRRMRRSTTLSGRLAVQSSRGRGEQMPARRLSFTVDCGPRRTDRKTNTLACMSAILDNVQRRPIYCGGQRVSSSTGCMQTNRRDD